MRIRRPAPLLVLMLASLALADLDSARSGRLQKRDAGEGLSQNDMLKLNAVNGAPVGRSKVTQRPAVAEPAQGAKATTTTRAYVGTEDAPVDGMDGKPHAGPFVDTTPEKAKSRKAGNEDATSTAKSLPTSLENLASSELGDIPEKNNGVMNDEGRPVPKEGTTGTEGGITEKSKERLAKGSLAENKPQEPKEVPPLPHSEQERISFKGKAADGSKADATRDGKSSNNDDGGDVKKHDGYGESPLGMDKPADLPEKPHNIPHPEPRGGKTLGSTNDNSGPPVKGGRKDWLQDTLPYTEGQAPPRPKTDENGAIIAAETEWHEWFHSFVLSLTMILFSEIGDKTFLIAALMAMRHPRLLVFSAALCALVAMTVLSAVLGHAVPTLLPKRFTTFAAAILFLVFGAKMLKEGLEMDRDSGVGEEMKEVEAELEEKEHDIARRHSRQRGSSTVSPYALESGRSSRGRAASAKLPSIEPSPPSSRSPSPKDRSAGLMNLLSLVLSPVWVQTFVMTFLGEWGDRSQIATIAMAAGQDYWWVTLGAVTGHACCTGIAVLGGRALAGRVSMRVVTIGGAVAFLVFGVIYLYECTIGGGE